MRGVSAASPPVGLQEAWTASAPTLTVPVDLAEAVVEVLMIRARLQTLMIDEAQAIEIAKRAAAGCGGRAISGIYQARRVGDRWHVGVQWIVDDTADGAPLHPRGGHHLYVIDGEGRVVGQTAGR